MSTINWVIGGAYVLLNLALFGWGMTLAKPEARIAVAVLFLLFAGVVGCTAVVFS